MPFLSKSPAHDVRETRSRYLWTPTRGVRATLDERAWLDEVKALALVIPTRTVFSHTTAAVLADLPLPNEDPRPFHFTSDSNVHRGRRKGVKWHLRHVQGQVITWHGFPITHPLRTWRDLGDLLQVPDLVAVADVLLRRGWCSQADLLALTGVRHKVKLRKAAERADGGSWSPRESLLRVAMLDEGVPEPELNGEIVEGGTVIGTGDFVWREYRTVADYDGGHHNQPGQRHQDAQTRDDYAAEGWRHVPITSKMSQSEGVDRVTRALRQRGWEG